MHVSRIGQLVQEGVQRTLARNGPIFVAITWVLSVLNALFGNAVARNAVDQMPRGISSTGGVGGTSMEPTLGLPPAVAGLLSMAVGLVSPMVVAAALRTFVTSEQESIPSEFFTRNLGWMVVNLIIGGIVFGLAIGQIGSEFGSIFVVAVAARTYKQLTKTEGEIAAL